MGDDDLAIIKFMSDNEALRLWKRYDYLLRKIEEIDQEAERRWRMLRRLTDKRYKAKPKEPKAA